MQLHAYQQRAIEHLNTHPAAMLWLDMGLGKTAITLSSIAERLNRMECYGALVIAPLRVVQSVWKQEAQKWPHLRGLRFASLTGERDTRTRNAMLPADIYMVNYENLTWLADTWTKHYLSRGRYLPVNMVVYDEVSKMKASSTRRQAAVLRLLSFLDYRVGLTGTPAPNGYSDLWGQYLVVDSGARLGQTVTEYRKRFLQADNPMSPFGKQSVRPGAAATIEALIGDITIQMNNADYLELPPVVPNEIPVTLPPDLRAKYDQLEKEMWIELDSGAEIESFNKASMTNRCLQFGQGAMYLTPGSQEFEEVHTLKLDALDEVVEEAAGKPVLTAVQFRHDARRILKRHPTWRWVNGDMNEREFNETLDRWGRGELPGIIVHPASMGHGVDRLKDGPVDDVVWFGHNWSLDLYEQLIARLQRQGRTRPIRMHHLHCIDTVEDAQRIALRSKAQDQNGLKAAVNEYRGARGH